MKTRVFHTRFWDDDDFTSSLSMEHKLLFIYLITNSKINICGIYELPLRKIAYDTGIAEDVIKDGFRIFQENNKVRVKNGWVRVVNVDKFNNYKGQKNEVARDKETACIPDNVYEYLMGNDTSIDTSMYTVPIVTRNKKSEIRNKKSEIIISEQNFSNSKELLYWQEKVGTSIRTKHKENIAAAKRLKEMLGGADLTRAIETVRIVRADKYAGKALHMIGNYIQLEKNIELIENYRAGLEDRPAFDKSTTKTNLYVV